MTGVQTCALPIYTLLYSISEEWGGDAIVIGYGCELIVYSKTAIENELDNWAIQLLTQYPNASEYIKRNPLRAIHYLSNDKIKRKILINKLLRKKVSIPFFDPVLKDGELWLTRTNCDICKKCNLPLMTEETSSYLH